MLAKAYSISLTTDACQLSTGDSYVAVTGHWIDDNWSLLSCVLGYSASNGMWAISSGVVLLCDFATCSQPHGTTDGSAGQGPRPSQVRSRVSGGLRHNRQRLDHVGRVGAPGQGRSLRGVRSVCVPSPAAVNQARS